METLYERQIVHRSMLRFILGALARIRNYCKYKRSAEKARKKGAKLGECVTLSPDFVCKLNSLVTIGSHTSIAQGCDLSSIFQPFTIGSHVIIGNDVKLIQTSHNIDSLDYEHVSKSGG